MIEMGNKTLILVLLFSFLVSFVLATSDHHHYQAFFNCMAKQGIMHNIYNPTLQPYNDLFISAQQNTRWFNSSSKPVFIFTPNDESQIQAAVTCCKHTKLQIRVKSGGHDYEGASFLSQEPYIILDLVNMRNVDIDLPTETAWVQTGTTLGELYYNIAKKSPVHAFPAGTCASVGTGGHISGGGLGMITRKYGLASDNVIDARIVDVNGKLLDRKAMGEDLFWAIRGSGGASFGIITAWRIKLVRVPPVVTTFTTYKYSNMSAAKFVHNWQFIANKLPKELIVRVFLQRLRTDNTTVLVKFNSLFLGNKVELIQLMKDRFPDLGLQETDCYEMSWINTTVFSNKQLSPLETLLNRTDPYRTNYKGKSDFVTTPIPETGIDGLFKVLMDNPDLLIIFDPYGGALGEIPEADSPFPHRKGILFNVQYLEKWNVNNANESASHLKKLSNVYNYMEAFVANNPRLGYINYKDYDLGINKNGAVTSYTEAKVWGEKYFKGNFERLAKVKAMVDPENFFRNEQSIPVFHEFTVAK